jgi:ribosomal protein S12 methylthiotransferase accessory factor
MGLNYEQSLIPALAEGLERYCTSIFSNHKLIWATAEELGNRALDLSTIPRCSEDELAEPKCPVTKPDKKKLIRWVDGISLLDGDVVSVPASLVYLNFPLRHSAERLCVPISTGCAAHSSLEGAILRGILEVIERDAVSLAWLQMLPLPRIDFSHGVPTGLVPYFRRGGLRGARSDTFLFDATMDLGVPTIYGVQRSEVDKRISTIVACSTKLDAEDAIAKVMLDLAQCRIYLRNRRNIPTEWKDFNEVYHGASFMAGAEQSHAFDFLIRSNRQKKMEDITSFGHLDTWEALQLILTKLRHRKMNVYAVDLSTDEALRVGMHVVRIIIPELQPLSFNYSARYLGHPRLYEVPHLMGAPVLSESELNHWPQPFA